MKVMIWNAARGGMRSVVESYHHDGLLGEQGFTLIASYADGNFLYRQIIFVVAFLRFLALLLSRHVELVHCHAAMHGSFWRKACFSVLARRFGVPVVLHLHGSEMKGFYAAQIPFVRKLIVRQLTWATRVVVLSESWRTFVGKIAPLANIVVVPNYIRVAQQTEKQPHDKIVVAFMGVLGPRKGIYDLLAAVAKARRRIPELMLLVGGNGEIEAARTRAVDLGIADSVSFLGWVDAAKRSNILALADVYALPSYNEGLPMSLLEAMSSGLPVLTTPVGGIPELVTDGVEGLLVEPGDVDAIADALVKFACDRKWREEAGKAARKRVAENYGHQVVLPRLRSLYDEVASMA